MNYVFVAACILSVLSVPYYPIGAFTALSVANNIRTPSIVHPSHPLNLQRLGLSARERETPSINVDFGGKDTTWKGSDVGGFDVVASLEMLGYIAPKASIEDTVDSAAITSHKDKLSTIDGLVLRKGYSIHYQVHGNGPKRIALIMGYGASMKAWHQILENYAKNDEYSILVLDNRGVGRSTSGQFEMYSTEGMAMDFLAVLDHSGWTQDRSVNLLGCSMGGMIAMHAAFMSREYVSF